VELTAMTAPDGMTAVLLQISGITHALSDLDHRQAGDARDIRDRVAALITQVNRLKATVAGHDDALAAVQSLDEQVSALAARLAADATEAPGYQPAAPPRLWKLDDAERGAAIGRLRGWVDQVYRPGYGHFAAGLADCWDQHPLCLYILDWLSELWSVLYLRPTRTAGTLAGQAEWHTRLLPAAADQLAHETRRCGHAAARHRASGWTGARP